MPQRSDSPPPRAVAPEVRRRRREGWIILATALAVVVFAFFEIRLPQSSSSASLGTDAVLVALINLNLILLVLLVFLVGRNIVKLILDRRRRIMGSHLRTRLVTAFVAIALLPATLLFLVAMSFVGNSIEKWFNGQVENALQGSLQIAHAYYEDLASTALGFARQTAARLAAERLLEAARREALKAFLQGRREELQLDLVAVFAGGRALARSRRPDLPQDRLGVDAWSDLVRRAMRGEEATAVDAVGDADIVRAGAPVLVDGTPVGAVVVDAYVPKSVVKRREEIDRSFGEFLRLKIQRRPIQTAYMITLALVTLVVLFSATWVGFYVARGITVPIQRLAEGTRAVAQGDLDHRIAGEGDDEIGTLVAAFNRMTEDLKAGRAEIESRRRYLEIVLANITAGVISTDAEGRVTTMNEAAAALLGTSGRACIGQPLATVCAGEAFAQLRQLAAQRLRRRYAAQLRDGGAVLDDCTRTIIQQVEELKTLVNEFATFARLPAGAHTPQDMNALVEEALVLFRAGHREVEFSYEPGLDLPVLELDREGVKRAVINLVDNAVAACRARTDLAPGERRRVAVRTSFDPRLGVVRLEIADNGFGVPPEVKARLFEPYFSTKPDGTGLGLAIVSAIVADHNGFVRVRDNLPRASRFSLEFPVRRQAAQLAAQARYGAYAGG